MLNDSLLARVTYGQQGCGVYRNSYDVLLWLDAYSQHKLNARKDMHETYWCLYDSSSALCR